MKFKSFLLSSFTIIHNINVYEVLRIRVIDYFYFILENYNCIIP